MDEKKILIVDDEPGARTVLEALLAKEDYRLFFASDGQEALDQVDDLLPDLVLLDVMMPGMNGFEVCGVLKNDERWQHIPIIILTALTGTEDLARGFELGADDFLSKPFNSVELIARVRSMLRIKAQYDLLEKQRQDLAATLEIKEELARITGQRLEELEILHKVGLDLMNSLDADYMVEVIIKTTYTLIPNARSCEVRLLSDDEQKLEPQPLEHLNDAASLESNLGNETIIQQTLDTKEAIYVADVQADARYLDLGLSEVRTVIVIPLVVDGRAVGVLTADSIVVDAFETARQRILSILANQLSVAIMKARLFDELAYRSGLESHVTN